MPWLKEDPLKEWGLQLPICRWNCLWEAGVTCSAMAHTWCRVSWQTQEPGSSGTWHAIPGSAIPKWVDICSLGPTPVTTLRAGRVWEVGRRDGRRNVLPFISSLCHLLVLEGICGSLPPEMCSAWYGGGWVFRLLCANIIEVLTMPTFEMQREIVVPFIWEVWKIVNL